MSSNPAPGERPSAGRTLDAVLELLDRQIVDPDGALAGKVDDLELTFTDEGDLVVTAILSGPGALAPRLEGRLGRWWAATFRRLHPAEDPEPARIAFVDVVRLDDKVEVAEPRHQLDSDRFERWARDHVIAHIPGGRRDPG